MGKRVVRIVLLILILVLFAALCVSIVITKREDARYAADEKVATDIREMVVTEIAADDLENDILGHKPRKDTESAEPIDVNLLRKIDFDHLQEINGDAERWIYIPDTNIDYYVLQEQITGRFRYLWRDIYGNSSSWGSIFIPAQGEDDAHLLIFGHHMQTHEYAFATITEYVSYDFAAEHPYVYIYYPDHAERWAVWCAGHVYGNDMVYQTPYLTETQEYQELLDHIVQMSEVTLTDAPSFDEDVLVLSTCHRAWGGASGRCIVACRLDQTYRRSEQQLTSEVARTIS